jgi:hypothetical protein
MSIDVSYHESELVGIFEKKGGECWLNDSEKELENE